LAGYFVTDLGQGIPPDEVPSRRCGCGFYGYGALSVLRAEYPRAGDVTAVVSLWGRLVPARLGRGAQNS
jgi:hypothetical protein